MTFQIETKVDVSNRNGKIGAISANFGLQGCFDDVAETLFPFRAVLLIRKRIQQSDCFLSVENGIIFHRRSSPSG